MYREVGRDRRHLSLHAQLQRGAPDLCRLRQQLRVPPQENMGETLKAGNGIVIPLFPVGGHSSVT